jgi:hypothetical protein
MGRVMSRPIIDIAGQRFGRWTVLAIHPKRVRYGRARKAVNVLWICRCICGTERVVLGCNLRAGVSTSCGCFQREKTRARSTKHGQARRGNHTRAYDCWVGMLQRCFNPNNKFYPNYGGRGIRVCDDWLSFENFFADMGEPPASMTLDRCDVNGNYESTNCRWATRAEQSLNRRPPKRRKRRRSTLAEICAYADALARAASTTGRE